MPAARSASARYWPSPGAPSTTSARGGPDEHVGATGLVLGPWVGVSQHHQTQHVAAGLECVGRHDEAVRPGLELNILRCDDAVIRQQLEIGGHGLAGAKLGGHCEAVALV